MWMSSTPDDETLTLSLVYPLALPKRKGGCSKDGEAILKGDYIKYINPAAGSGPTGSLHSPPAWRAPSQWRYAHGYTQNFPCRDSPT